MNRRGFLVQSAFSAAALSSLGRPPAAKAAEPPSIFEQVRAGRPLEGVDAIDAHAHLDTISGDLIWPLGVDMLEADSRRCGIGLTIVSPFEGFMATHAGQLRAAHDACVEAVAKYKKSLRAYLVFQPHLLKASVEEMQRALDPDSPFVGFKLHGAIDQYPADGPNYQPVFEFANEHGLPVLYHQWGGLERVASTIPKYPRMNMILAHLGLWTSPDNLGTYLKALPNLYTDTCSSVLPYRGRRPENPVWHRRHVPRGRSADCQSGLRQNLGGRETPDFRRQCAAHLREPPAAAWLARARRIGLRCSTLHECSTDSCGVCGRLSRRFAGWYCEYLVRGYGRERLESLHTTCAVRDHSPCVHPGAPR